ncbi:MarR family winged helix-turn-helix transcriptional regulator [Brevibacillus centrosporus]|uniref:MarR family winged helix-turn-helix transcriptional regulator n=1 Tax=Brevibacillus centrosporus TaxID=54910 RepID=UPI002E1AA899|nr:MarR family transcriptional regulator [Brevibacillus centrosporus]MED4909736.1 MarR family transcriptional regulator [Brevibacillus centrosporus]
MDGKVSIILHVLRLAAQINRMGLRLVEGTGLSSVQQWQLLGIIARNEGITLGKLSHEILVTKQNMTGLIERMQNGGWVSTWSDPSDKRITRVKITEKGREVFAMMQPRADASNTETFQDFHEEELEMMNEMLERLSRSLRLQLDGKE